MSGFVAGATLTTLTEHLNDKQGPWCWGLYSPQKVQRIAAMVQKDVDAIKEQNGIDFVMPDLDAVARMGTSGKYPQKMHTDMAKIFGGRAEIPEPSIIDIPMKDQISEADVTAAQSILYPHVLCSSLFHNMTKVFFSHRTHRDRC